MAKSRTGKPADSQPFLNHDVMSQAEQARFLGSKPERTKNLGHNSTVDRLTENPARPTDYEQGPAARVINEKRSVGVYERFDDPKSGISASENLDRWADYARSNSYSVDGRGRDPKGRGRGSDGHLATPKWTGYDAGADSGEGRLQKRDKY
jgi:hypothetical protein